jgi:16S rRNA (adenine1518-N6/adenine1519-N6)-dimethyltransferase
VSGATHGDEPSSPFRPSRSKGQCFLRDERYVHRIVEAVAPAPDETLLEIGGGAGQLTLPLARAGAHVVTVESDPRLVAELKTRIAGAGELSSRIEVVEKDALSLDVEELAVSRSPGGGRVRVCGNLPYSVASPILLHLLEGASHFSELVLMFQSEVAERLVAKPGTKAYGFLTVIAQQAAVVKVLFRIPPEAFRPRPRVVSALLRFQIRDGEAPDVGDEKVFRALVRGLLTHRRKTISNNIKRLGAQPISAPTLQRAVEAMRIDPRRRAETLRVDEFAALSRIYASLG